MIKIFSEVNRFNLGNLIEMITIKLPSVSQEFQRSRDFVTQTTGHTLNTVAETVENAKTAFSEVTNQATVRLTQTANQGIEVISQTTETAKTSLQQTMNQAVDTLNQTKNQAIDTVGQITTQAQETLATATNQAVQQITEATEQAKISLEEAIQTAAPLNNVAGEALQQAVNTAIQHWVQSYPVIVWFLSHPRLSLILLLLSLFLSLGLLQALNSLFREFWLLILQSPRKFILKLFSLGVQTINFLRRSIFPRQEFDNSSATHPHSSLAVALTPPHPEPQKRLADILLRLEELRQEQNILLQEASVILRTLSTIK